MTHPDESADPWASPPEGQQPPPPPPPGVPAPYGQPPAYGPPPGYGQQPPPYGQPGYGPGYGYPQPRSTNGFAIASMVLGILWIYWIGSILALIFGYVARGQIKAGNQQGDGMAIAGIVLGWIGVGILLLLIVLGAAAGAGAFA